MDQPASNTYVTVWSEHRWRPGQWVIERSYQWHYAKQVIEHYQAQGENWRAFPYGLNPNESQHPGWIPV